MTQPNTPFSNPSGPGNAPFQSDPGVSAPQPSAATPPSPAPGIPTPAAATPYGGVVYAPVPEKRRGWIVGLVAVILMFVAAMAGIASCSSVFGAMTPQATEPQRATSPTVAVIEIDGTIQYDGTTSSPEGLRAQLDRAESDPNIRAVVLRVNSGGGVATAGEEMSVYVRDFSKPVVVSSASMNASAAYEISSQADYIFTAETTAIGSIGTVMQITDMSGLMEKLGISVDSIASADSKDSSYGYRPLTEEERAHYQAMVDQINETFIQRVAAGRSMTMDEVRQLANGMTYTGLDAVDNGLADEIGTLEDAQDAAAAMAGLDSYSVMYLHPSTQDIDALLSLLGMEDKSSAAELAAALKELYGESEIR